MDKESLFISEYEITVDYVFSNTSQQDLVVPIAFPMPAMYFGPNDHSGIRDFKLWVDGKAIKTKRQLVILLDDKTDISKKIAEYGWHEEDLIDYIRDDGFVADAPPKGKKSLPKEWFDGGRPLFTLNEYFIWQQKFLAGKPVSIKHSYSPAISSSVSQDASYLIKDYAKVTCLDKGTQVEMRKLGNEYGLNWSYISYILVTANNWQGAIKDFNLTIRKLNPKDLVSLCFDGDLKKIDPLTFEFHQKNFKPTHDLNLLFTRKPE
jgi:hypothetical protein